MNQYSNVSDLKAEELEYKFSEYYSPCTGETKLNFNTTVYTEKFNISIGISSGNTNVHFMDNLTDDGTCQRTVHVSFSTDVDEGYSVMLFKMNFTGDENDFIQEYDGIDSIPEVDLRRCSLDIETLRAMAKLSVEIEEYLKKNETIKKCVL